jgi:hypothetical protein
VARISSPWHDVHRRIRLPGSGEKPFPPLIEPVNWTYAPRQFRPTSGPGARSIRAERHNPYSIATLRIKLARFLLKQLPCCPFCRILRL